MGLEVQFRPAGRCDTCKFSELIPDHHYQKKHHPMFCRFNPPTGPTAAPGDGPWNHKVPVSERDYCAQWKDERS